MLNCFLIKNTSNIYQSSGIVDDKNNIYTIVSGLCARVNPKGNPEEDFIMEGFFSVIKLGNDTIENIYPIDDPFINPDYYILNFANF